MTLILTRYRLDPVQLGRGGMGVVWGAQDEKLGRRVAIKFIRFPDGVRDPELEARFTHEAKIMSRLAHPGAPVLHDFGDYRDPLLGDRLFMVMQFVEGTGVDDVVAEHGPLPQGWVASIGAQVAAVLAAAHGLGILHRDLKPSNLMLCRDGSIQVVDFGLALMQDPGMTKLTRTGQQLGTAAYMSPEQVNAEQPTERSDVYSLGAVLHELLTGRQLFTGPSEYSVMNQHVNARPTAVGRLRPDVPKELDELILAMVEKRPEDRPATAAEVHDRLMPYLAGTGPLGDMTAPGPSPVRMYSHAVSRTLTAGAQPMVPAMVPAAGNAPVDDDFSRGDIGRARRQAVSLVRESRYRDAADVLAGVAAAASRKLGAADTEVIDLRGQLADVLLTGQDYRRAAQEFRRIADDLLLRPEPDHERVSQCRLQEATCHVHAGDPELALHIMRELLADEGSRFPEDDARLLELRCQIGELEIGVGAVDRARATLTSLCEDLTRLYGPEHGATIRVVDLLTGLGG
ncbi:serine/threonine protein kinase [Streptosporangium sp. NBC_01810]|uniref:serine/threonine-protein kinase n=1 Tax=Streptosporangium sp. NBC_01810 TaxID=2975951 RepID=UPI002DDB3660|nr:serine/threonine-protein kinase [Streptosporangium sp. NBC_01810]WSA25400.1 serine/threonine protein kinase [Streptosporangium sp. NBC_01810]